MTLNIIEIHNNINENLARNLLDKSFNSILIYDTLSLEPKVKYTNPNTLVS